MRRQRNISHIKEQIKTPEEELNKIKTSNLLDAQSKTLVIRMLRKLRGRVEELRENLNSIKKDLENIKYNQCEMKDILIEMENNLPGI